MKAKTSSAKPKRLRVDGQQMVVLRESEYRRLAELAGEYPPLPPPNKRGNYPADQTLAVLVARDLIRRRRHAGLTQEELARRAGIRPETLRRIEQAKHSPSVGTVEKIERALKRAEEVGG